MIYHKTTIHYNIDYQSLKNMRPLTLKQRMVLLLYAGVATVQAILSCPAPCTYSGSQLPQPLPLPTSEITSNHYSLGDKYIISDGNQQQTCNFSFAANPGCPATQVVIDGSGYVDNLVTASFISNVLTINFEFGAWLQMVQLITHEDGDGIVYSISYQSYNKIGHRDGNLGCIDCDTRKSQTDQKLTWACNTIVTNKQADQDALYQQPSGQSFTFPGATADFLLSEYVNLVACDVLKEFCGQFTDTSAFDSFELDYAVQVKTSYTSGAWQSITSLPFSFTDQPLKLSISGSTQIASYYEGQIDFRLCADGIQSCQKESLFSINYIDNCSSYFNWKSSAITLDQPFKVASRPANIFDVVINGSSSGTLSWTFNHESHADCGSKSIVMAMQSGDGEHTSYYTQDESQATFTLNLDATRQREQLRTTTLSVKFTSDYHPGLESSTQIVTVHEILCMVLSPKPEHVVFVNSEPQKVLQFAGLDTLDATNCFTDVETFQLESQALSSYPWLVQGDRQITFNVLDTSSITFDGHYLGVHSRGFADEPFDLIVCAIHPPNTIFQTWQALKEFIKDIKDPDQEYTVTIGQFTATQEAACGSLQVSVIIDDQGKHDPTASALEYEQSADKLTHTFKKLWTTPETKLRVKVSFKFSNAQDAAYEVNFGVNVYDCTMQVPALSSTSASEFLPMENSFEMNFLPWSFNSGSDCQFNQYELLLTDRDLNTMKVDYKLDILSQKWVRGTPIYSASQNKLDFITDDLDNNKVTFSKNIMDSKSVTQDYDGDYTVQIRGGYDLACCSSLPDHTLLFTYTLLNSPVIVNEPIECSSNLVVRLEQYNYIYRQSSKPLVVVFDQVSNGDCRYGISVYDAKSGQILDPKAFKISQPTFEQKEKGLKGRVSQTKAGYLLVQSLNAKQNGHYELQIQATDLSGQDQSIAQEVFKVEIEACVAVEESFEQLQQIEYVLGSGARKYTFPIQRADCQNYEILLDHQLQGTSFVKFEKKVSTVELTVQTSNQMEIGSHQFSFVKRDLNSLNEAVTRIELEIIDDESQEQILDDNQTLAFTNQFRDKILAKIDNDDKANEQESDTKVPLKAQVYDLTPTGNLTIYFSRPLFKLPPIEIYNLTDSDTSLANSTQHPQNRTLQKQNSQKTLQIKQVLNITVQSPFYEADEEQIQIRDYNLTRMTSTVMELQLEFSQPKALAQSLIEPDDLEIQFNQPGLFIDYQGLSISKEQKLRFQIVTQRTQEEIDEIESLSKSIGSALNQITIYNLVINIILGVGMKYLWKMVNLLQFTVFMPLWLILIPVYTYVWLTELKSLALFEFLPTEEIGSWLKSWMDLSSEDACDDNQSDTCIDPNALQPSIFGENAMIILAFMAILTVCLILLLLRICIKRSEKIKKCYDSLYRKIFHGTWIRFVLLSSLKLQINFCGLLAIGLLIKPTPQQPEKETPFKIFALSVVIVLWLAPALFSLILFCNRQNLNHRAVKAQIGALYENFRSDKTLVASYPIVFLVRRFLFVLVTYLIRQNPCLQIQTMLLMTLAHLGYISQMSFYESRALRRIEMLNECFLLALCYHFVLFTNYAAVEQNMKKVLGDSAVGCVIGLLVFNSILILAVNIQFIRLRIKLCCNKRAARQKQKEKCRIGLSKAQNSDLPVSEQGIIEAKVKLGVPLNMLIQENPADSNGCLQSIDNSNQQVDEIDHQRLSNLPKTQIFGNLYISGQFANNRASQQSPLMTRDLLDKKATQQRLKGSSEINALDQFNSGQQIQASLPKRQQQGKLFCKNHPQEEVVHYCITNYELQCKYCRDASSNQSLSLQYRDPTAQNIPLEIRTPYKENSAPYQFDTPLHLLLGSNNKPMEDIEMTLSENMVQANFKSHDLLHVAPNQLNGTDSLPKAIDKPFGNFGIQSSPELKMRKQMIQNNAESLITLEQILAKKVNRENQEIQENLNKDKKTHQDVLDQDDKSVMSNQRPNMQDLYLSSDEQSVNVKNEPSILQWDDLQQNSQD